VISVSDEAALREYVVAKGLVPARTPFDVRYLRGGVSCEVVRVRSAATEFVVKQALPRLRVKDAWFCDVRRIFTEKEAMAAYQRIVPGAVPALRFFDGENFLLAMEAAPASAETWKDRLMRGTIEDAVAVEVARTLAAVHEATARDPEVRERFREVELFIQLRIDPYWRTIAERHPDLAPAIRAEIERNLATKLALVHGDYSPKNILVAPGRLFVLDFECAHFGDPGYDIAFVVNHLLLKAVKNKGWAPAYLRLARTLARTYFGAIRFTDAASLERHAVTALALLLLARVDGKSPAEYLVDDADKDLVRGASRDLLRERPGSFDAVADLVGARVERAREERG
jgi:aminoglycoside phosphotransferase (APT) family kinase protein